MKKNILISATVLAFLSVTAFGYVSWNQPTSPPSPQSCSKRVVFEEDTFQDAFLVAEDPEPEFVYVVEPRFFARITLEDLQNAQTVVDIYPQKATEWMTDYQNVRISLEQKEEGGIETGTDENLTEGQKALLKKMNYGSNFVLRSDCYKANPETGDSEYYDLVFAMSVIPAKQAQYSLGQDALIKYLSGNSEKEVAAVEYSKLKPGRVTFTVTQKGTLADVRLTAASGYPELDAKMVELITEMQALWIPAANAKGELVEQELTFFFGQMGC